MRDGDRIVIDAVAHTIDLDVDRPPSSSARKADWKLPEPRYTTGVLAKYARLAQGAERGAITGLSGFRDMVPAIAGKTPEKVNPGVPPLLAAPVSRGRGR